MYITLCLRNGVLLADIARGLNVSFARSISTCKDSIIIYTCNVVLVHLTFVSENEACHHTML